SHRLNVGQSRRLGLGPPLSTPLAPAAGLPVVQRSTDPPAPESAPAPPVVQAPSERAPGAPSRPEAAPAPPGQAIGPPPVQPALDVAPVARPATPIPPEPTAAAPDSGPTGVAAGSAPSPVAPPAGTVAVQTSLSGPTLPTLPPAQRFAGPPRTADIPS